MRTSKVFTAAISAVLVAVLGFGVTEAVAPSTAATATNGGSGCC